MEKIANWIVENPYLTAAGLFATFLGLIIAIITPIIQKRRKNLCFSYSTTPLVKKDVSNINGIEISFHGSPVEQLSVSNVQIWNGGNTIISFEDFYKGHELSLSFQDNATILGIDMLKQSEDTIECKTELSCDKVDFSFQAFEKKEYISFNLYHTGNAETKLLLNGKIKEGKILNKTVDIEKQISLVMDIGNISLIPLASGIGSLFLAIVSLFTVGHHNKSDR
jgi:hypothetical protein